MTDLATALADTSALHSFDGHPVLRSTIAVTNAGDGLSNALKIDPCEFAHGQKVYVVLECEVSKIAFVPIPDTDALSRVHTFRAEGATIVDADAVKRQLDEQADRILKAREEAEGLERIPFGEEPPEGGSEPAPLDEEKVAEPESIPKRRRNLKAAP